MDTFNPTLRIQVDAEWYSEKKSEVRPIIFNRFITLQVGVMSSEGSKNIIILGC